MRSSIKMAFLGSVIVLAVVLLGLLTIISVTMRSSQMEADVAERLEAQGTGIAERFDNVLTRVAGKTDGLATTLSAMNGTYNMTYAEQRGEMVRPLFLKRRYGQDRPDHGLQQRGVQLPAVRLVQGRDPGTERRLLG